MPDRVDEQAEAKAVIGAALDQASQWGWKLRPVIVVEHDDNGQRESASTFPIAWHAARMTLFVSWACMGMLVRAVHCNVGRPELWVMLPTD
ncbi:hypothetical protein [Novipirellula artificiosorum]|uniref:hypothetical protein n=1 Tax=Novipirellula artificiosorum TaxID=2528016 RepID=UPI0011B3DFED|nr:hypothetical protein [Novipirellula artificiosorum]